MRLALAQLNPMMGDVAGNAAAVRGAYADGLAAGADLVATPELVLTGYPPEDLVCKGAFVEANQRALGDVAIATGAVPLVVGFVERSHNGLANAAAVCRGGRVEAVYRKQRLPNYGVFDEARYFHPGRDPLVFQAGGVAVGITICEDLWAQGGPPAQASEAGAALLVNINASPYHRGKRAERESLARHHATACGAWLAYLNAVGGQDEVVFDGDSFVLDPAGEVVARGAQFREALLVVDIDVAGGAAPRSATAAGSASGSSTAARLASAPASSTAAGSATTGQPRLDELAEVYAALVLGTGDYVRKNGFRRALLGLSGGVDSALVAAIAADALGADAVTGVAMPSPYSSPPSLIDAKALAANLGIGWLELEIEPVMRAFDEALREPFARTKPGLAEENLQSRIRGTLLMALSNKRGDIVLATGNKSEYAVGYSTLYGDMAGGFAVIKDVSKTLVYQLSHHRNAVAGDPLIPQAILDKPPSAELRPDQRDTDSLPPYDELDPILEAYVEQDRSVSQIVAGGHDLMTVRRVVALVDRAEYKRRQAPPGVKITPRAFGKDRRLPITQAWSG